MIITVSDHAVMRLLERKYGVDFTVFRKEIEGVVADACAAGATSVKKDGLKYALAGNCVVTICPIDAPRTSGKAGKRPRRSQAEAIGDGAE